jgi:hypothetical protein
MRIHEIINESPSLGYEEQRILNQYEKIEAHITTNCLPYIIAAGGIDDALFEDPLWRGVYHNEFTSDMGMDKPVKSISINSNRTPLDTPDRAHHLIDDWFNKYTGYRFRSSSLFVTGSSPNASTYGKLVRVIPEGEFHFCWSPKIQDMYEALSEYAYLVGGPTIGDRKQAIHYLKDDNIIQFLEDSEFLLDKDLTNAIYSRHEIMIVAKSALIVDNAWCVAVQNIRRKLRMII